MIGTFKGREIKEDKNQNTYYRVKTDQKPEGEEYPIAFNAFNSEHSKYADIAKALRMEGERIIVFAFPVGSSIGTKHMMKLAQKEEFELEIYYEEEGKG